MDKGCSGSEDDTISQSFDLIILFVKADDMEPHAVVCYRTGLPNP